MNEEIHEQNIGWKVDISNGYIAPQNAVAYVIRKVIVKQTFWEWITRKPVEIVDAVDFTMVGLKEEVNLLREQHGLPRKDKYEAGESIWDDEDAIPLFTTEVDDEEKLRELLRRRFPGFERIQILSAETPKDHKEMDRFKEMWG